MLPCRGSESMLCGPSRFCSPAGQSGSFTLEGFRLAPRAVEGFKGEGKGGDVIPGPGSGILAVEAQRTLSLLLLRY